MSDKQKGMHSFHVLIKVHSLHCTELRKEAKIRHEYTKLANGNKMT